MHHLTLSPGPYHMPQRQRVRMSIVTEQCQKPCHKPLMLYLFFLKPVSCINNSFPQPVTNWATIAQILCASLFGVPCACLDPVAGWPLPLKTRLWDFHHTRTDPVPVGPRRLKTRPWSRCWTLSLISEESAKVKHVEIPRVQSGYF